ncbi:MAG: nucleotide modification associated domain-containing protein [Chitinophagaceae bacterium]
MNNNELMNETELRTITEDVIKILLKKNQDYGGASFDLGLTGNMVHLWDKVKRYRTLVERKITEGGQPNFESIQDTLKDVIGYAIIGMLILKSENSNATENTRDI